ncbi:MAG TPA: TIGR03067 domain-containing protein [Gemmataceae bacterium]|jgi:uncharacterized protein (TIGR03067 family)|nr:TIGR03067 domain-containing protein [Gemmataceae bacterium]
MRKMMVALTVCVLFGADSPKDAIKKEMGQLQGEWSMVSGERDGESLPEDLVQDAKRVTKEDEVTVTLAGQVYLKAKFAISPSKKPKTIDYTLQDGSEKGKTMLGIYELEGDKVKFCFSSPGKDRPTEFNTKEDSGKTLSVWKRDKK